MLPPPNPIQSRGWNYIIHSLLPNVPSHLCVCVCLHTYLLHVDEDVAIPLLLPLHFSLVVVIWKGIQARTTTLRVCVCVMPPVAKDEAAGAATSHHGAVRSSVVLFLSSEGTHLCRCGDVKPAPLPPHMRGTPTPSMRGQTSSTPTCSFSPITEEMLHHLATTTTASAASSSHAGPSSPLFSTLRGLLLGRDVVLILPLSWAPASMEKLLLLLMHEKVVGIASAVVLSDVMASSMASGVADGVVLHCSSTHYTFGRVLMGATVRYASSRCGSLSRVRATAKTALDGGVEEDLSSAAFRGELVEAFGFRCYKRAWEEFTMRRLLAAGGGGKGKGRKRVREEAEPEDWWRHYTKQDRLRPGTLEVLLARVLEKGKHPAMLVGEGLRIPFMAELMHHLLRRCRPEATLKAVGRSSNTRAAPTPTAVVNVDENEDEDSDDEEEEEESESSATPPPSLVMMIDMH